MEFIICNSFIQCFLTVLAKKYPAGILLKNGGIWVKEEPDYVGKHKTFARRV